MQPIQFFFELASPYSYLASLQIEALAHDATRQVDWCPVDIEVVWKAHGVLDAYSAIRHLKRSYIGRDSHRCAEALGVTLKKPVTPARDTKLAKLVYWGLLSSERALAERFIRTTWRAYFQDGMPIGTVDDLAVATSDIGLAREAIKSACSLKAQDAQDQANAQAIATGCFGIPWFAADGEVFFGHDRLPYLARHLQRKTDA
jgi:2-hydroxychromene-2-carboxylate isomerase